jgi:hypothetical protein
VLDWGFDRFAGYRYKVSRMRVSRKHWKGFDLVGIRLLYGNYFHEKVMLFGRNNGAGDDDTLDCLHFHNLKSADPSGTAEGQ